MCIFEPYKLMSLSKVIHYSGTQRIWYIYSVLFCLHMVSFAQNMPNNELLTDSVVNKEPVLLDRIKRHADGYMVIDRKDNKLYMYDGAELFYPRHRA